MLYGDGSTSGGYYDQETAYQYGLGDAAALGLALTALPGALGLKLPSVGKALTSVASTATFGLVKRSKDPGRLATNAKAYTAAINRQPFSTGGVTYDPLAFLLEKSPIARGGGGGWATSKAEEDAWAKYQSAKAALAARAPTMRPVAPAPRPTLPRAGVIPARPGIPPILQPGRPPTGPNVPAFPGYVPPPAPSEGPAGYGGTPAFPMLPLLIGVGLIGALAVARSSGGRTWQ